ncbi:hypothetical protein ACS0TY_031484 [Phlomoides rotata]
MDDSSVCGTSTSEIESTESVSSSSASLRDHNTEDKLSTGVLSELKISGGNRTNHIDDLRKFPMDGYNIEEEEEEDNEDDDFSEEALLSQMGYTKSEPKRSDEEGEEEDEDDLSEEALLSQMGYTKSEPKRSDEEGEEEEEDISEESFPAQMGYEPVMAPTNLVSAFKGSREKEGKAPHKECRVSWSPEVYDPPCTSDDHFKQSKNERHRSEQKAKGVARKNRQKSSGKGVAIEVVGKGSKGGGSKASRGKSKDKKTKKHGGKKAGNYSAPGED